MNNETILVINDNPQIGEFIAKDLLLGLGYQGRSVHNGADALAEIRKTLPDLLLIDLELPDTSGLNLLRQLNRENISVPAILFAAHGSEQVAIEAFHLGVEDYLLKPIDPNQLTLVISRALENSHLKQEKNRLFDELNEQLDLLLALSKIGQSVTSTLDLNDVLKRIVEAAVHLTQAEEGFLALLDHSTGALQIRASKNIEGRTISTLRVQVADSLLGEVISTGKPVRATSQSIDKPMKISTGMLVNSLLNVPIFSKGRPLGVLSVENRRDLRQFTEQDEILLLSLADYAAVALENAGLYQQARREIGERKRIEAALRESEERYALAARGANDGIWDYDLKKNTLYLSPRWKMMVGCSEGELGENPNDWFSLVHPDDLENLRSALSTLINARVPHIETEYRILHKDGQYRWVVCRGVAVQELNGKVSRIAGSQMDISERKSVEARLQHDAFHDKLTGLPNRSLIQDHLQRVIQRAKQEHDYCFAVLFLDLDKFKDINDSLGHPTGDQLLIAIAQTLKKSLRRSDTVARLGGDEFVILMDGIRDEVDAIEKSKEIIAVLAKPIKVHRHRISISPSIGIVLSSQGYNSPDDILRDADIAMYAAKNGGRSTFRLFDPKMRQEILQRINLEAEIQAALEKNQFCIFYQPIISLAEGTIFGFEALVHWNHPMRGMLSADEFLPIAKEIGLLMQVDCWVLHEACRQMNDWQQRYNQLSPLIASVNLSGALLRHTDLIQIIKQILDATSFPPENLVLEISENIITMSVDSLKQTILELRSIGIRVQIDDFGKGSSSLLYMDSLPVDAVKIDRPFIDKISTDKMSTKVLNTIVSLAHELGFNTVAEGIENIDQLQCLRDMHCNYGQGHLLSSPLEVKAASELLAAEDATLSDNVPWYVYWQDSETVT